MKTNNFTVVLEDGSIMDCAWGGKAHSLRVALENDGYQPTAIFLRVHPLYLREGCRAIPRGAAAPEEGGSK